MITTTFCRTEHFCPFCKETGGEYSIPVTFYCFETPCQNPGVQCEYVRNGGVRG
jgi:hypothetical protein